jgi:hypothetical protein
MGAIARAVRIAYDKHVTGENMIKWGAPKEAPRCEFCGTVTSQRHTILECQSPQLENARRRAMMEIATRVEAIHVSNPAIAPIANEIKRQATCRQDHTLWTGTFSPELTRDFAIYEMTITQREYRELIKLLIQLAKAVTQMYETVPPSPQSTQLVSPSQNAYPKLTDNPIWKGLERDGNCHAIEKPNITKDGTMLDWISILPKSTKRRHSPRRRLKLRCNRLKERHESPKPQNPISFKKRVNNCKIKLIF